MRTPPDRAQLKHDTLQLIEGIQNEIRDVSTDYNLSNHRLLEGLVFMLSQLSQTIAASLTMSPSNPLPARSTLLTARISTAMSRSPSSPTFTDEVPRLQNNIITLSHVSRPRRHVLFRCQHARSAHDSHIPTTYAKPPRTS